MTDSLEYYLNPYKLKKLSSISIIKKIHVMKEKGEINLGYEAMHYLERKILEDLEEDFVSLDKRRQNVVKARRVCEDEEFIYKRNIETFREEYLVPERQKRRIVSKAYEINNLLKKSEIDE